MSPPTPLPSRPSLEHLKDQAADLRRAQPDISVAQSLYMIARTYGFESWPALKYHVDTLHQSSTIAKENPMTITADLDRKELYTFTTQLATLMMSGVPILESMEICAQTAKHPAFKSAILDARSKMREGEGIAGPLATHPEFFDGMYIQMVHVGEETGKLDMMLDRLGVFIASIAAHGGAINQMVLFTRQLSTMFEAGLPLVNCLSILAEQTSDATLKEPLTAVRDDVSSGVRLDEAMAKHPAVFDGYLVNMVRAGSLGGNLGQILSRSAEYLERVESFGKK